MQKPTLVIFCLILGTLVSCSTNTSRTTMMSDGQFTFIRLELVDSEDEIIVTDTEALDAIRTIIEKSPRLAEKSDEIEFAEMKKLRLINSDPEKSRIYVVDLKNGYSSILSKAVMPVYRIDDLDKLNVIIQTSGKPKPNAG